MNILIIDDSYELCEGLEKSIKKLNRRVITTCIHDLEHSAAFLQDNSIDLCIIDCEVEHKDTRFFIKYLKQRQQSVKVYVFSKIDNKQLQSAFLAAGADFFFYKVLDLKALLQKLRQVLS